MIAFDSPEGEALRAIDLSQPALLALWLSALNSGQMDWAHWVQAQASPKDDPNILALRCLHAAACGDTQVVRLIMTLLKTLPAPQRAQFYVRKALATTPAP